MSLPDPSFEHLYRLSDGTGIFEHAAGPSPREEYGYCTDDVARAVVVVLREPGTCRELQELESILLNFLEAAALPDGRFHNRRSAEPGCRWLDRAGPDDTNGRALWALGTVAARGGSLGVRLHATRGFERAAGFSSPSPRANATAVLGAVEVVAMEPANRYARRLLERAAARLGVVSQSPSWPWPEGRLAYENARLPEARIAAGHALGDSDLLAEGLCLLKWLVEVQTLEGHFSFAPVGGWVSGEPRPGFDQQPIEAGAMADACARAFVVTGDERWAAACVRAAAWFLGENDLGATMFDPTTGGCYDGLESAGVNLNEGAESTIALISALQQARMVQAA